MSKVLPFDVDECDCDCHANPDAIMHMIPCCHTCKYCGKRIAREAFEGHIERHEQDGDEGPDPRQIQLGI